MNYSMWRRFVSDSLPFASPQPRIPDGCRISLQQHAVTGARHLLRQFIVGILEAPWPPFVSASGLGQNFAARRCSAAFVHDVTLCTVDTNTQSSASSPRQVRSPQRQSHGASSIPRSRTVASQQTKHRRKARRSSPEAAQRRIACSEDTAQRASPALWQMLVHPTIP